MYPALPPWGSVFSVGPPVTDSAPSVRTFEGLLVGVGTARHEAAGRISRHDEQARSVSYHAYALYVRRRM